MKLKKTLSLTLALVLSLAMAVPAFAAEDPNADYAYTASNECVGTTQDSYGQTIYLYPVGTVFTPKDPFEWFGYYSASNTYTLQSTEPVCLQLLWMDAVYNLDVYVQGTGGSTQPEVKQVTVSFSSNSGSSVSDKTVTVGQAYGDLPTPTRTGYTFEGWYTSGTGGSEVTSSTTVTNTSNHSLYAHWNPGDFTQPGDRFATNKASTGTVTKEIDGKTEAVRLYPEGTVFSWKGPSANQGFGTVSIVGDRYLGSYFDTFTLKNDGIYYISIEGEVVYAMADSAQPEQPTTPVEPEKSLAKAGNQDIEIDGTKVAFQTYMLADANGNGTNYVKLRDIAHVLNGTGAQFSVGYNRQQQSISAATGEAYKDTGTEMDTPFAGADKEYVQSQLTIVVDGKPVQLDAITLMDDAGGAYNYFKLRDLGDALGFTVGYSRARGVYVETK